MENKSHAVIAISFLAVFIICIVAIFGWLESGPSEERRYVIVSSYDVNGLQKASPVRYQGIQVGSVKRIAFDPHDPTKVLVTIGVYPDAYITKATYAELAMQGITGVKYISLSIAPDKPRTPLHTSSAQPAVIPMHQSLLQSIISGGGGGKNAGFQDQLHKVTEVLDNVSRILSAVNTRHLNDTLQQLDAATQQLQGVMQRLEPAAKAAPGLASQAQDLLTRGSKAMGEVDRLAQSARRPMADAGAAIKSTRRLAATADQAVAKIDERTVPRLDQALEHLDRTLTQVDALARELKAKPQSLIYGTQKPPPGPGEPGFQAGGQGGSP